MGYTPFKMKSSPTKLFNFHAKNTKDFVEEGEEVGVINPKHDPETGLSTVSGKGSEEGSKKRDFAYRSN